MDPIEKEITQLWWNIYGSCFTGTSLNKKNALFMSTGNRIPSGSVFTLKKNIFSKITDKSLIFSYPTLRKIKGFPELKNADLSATPSCVSKLQYSNNTAIDIYGKLLDGTGIGKINAELQVLLKKAKALDIHISQWGQDLIEEGLLEIFLQDELSRQNPVIAKIMDGEHYIATDGIWVKGMSFAYQLDKDSVTRIAAIYEQHKQEFMQFGVTIDIASSTNLSTSFKYAENFYPFLKFRKIEKNGNIKMLGKNQGNKAVILSEADFSD
ncbi:hypothetical protein [Chryseobacterium sp.]|uniref:hypothetical protein n=1 Tax=Chryseobacterium sp. TaxID=1871047 RepID=UPI002896C9A0|nr:hypothetical protein [Chryseobacterium sp.]